MSEQQDETQGQTEGEQPDTPAEPTPEEEEEGEQEGEGEASEGGEDASGQTSLPAGAAGAVGEKELEKMFAKVERANATYSRRLGEIMGEEAAVLERCPRCTEPFLGFIFPPLMKPVTAEQKAAVLVSVGEAAEDELEQDPYARQCDICKGKGYTKTGAVLNRERRIACLACKGRGWLAVGDERRVAQQAVTVTDGTNGAVTPTEQPPDLDPWGRGPEHPDYGRMPQFVTAH
jgi:hypothetical protein